MKTNLEVLLGEWGRLRARENNAGHGYPSASAFTHERVQQSTRDNLHALMADEDTCRADIEIKKLHPDVRLVVHAHYIWPGVVKVKLHQLRMTRTAYYETLDFAHKQVSYGLGGKYTMCFPPILSGHLVALSG